MEGTMDKMVMFGRTNVTSKLNGSLIPVIVFRSALFNFPGKERCMRHPSTMGSGVSDFNTLIEKMLERNSDYFTLSLYKKVQSDLYTKSDTAIVELGRKDYRTVIDNIKSVIQEHFGEVDYIDCEENDASALLAGIC